MYRIKIDMDVYKFTLCAMKSVTSTEERIFVRIKVTPDYKIFCCSLITLSSGWDLMILIIPNVVMKQDVWGILCTMNLLRQE